MHHLQEGCTVQVSFIGILLHQTQSLCYTQSHIHLGLQKSIHFKKCNQKLIQQDVIIFHEVSLCVQRASYLN